MTDGTGLPEDPFEWREPEGTPEEICEANGHAFLVYDVDEDGEPLYVDCRRCSRRWSCLGSE